MAQVIDLRGESDRVARNLAAIGQGIGNIANPNKELQEQIKRLAISDPQAGSALGALPKEVAEGLGFGNLHQWLQQFPQTSGQLTEGRLRDKLANLDPEVAKAFDEFLVARQAGTTPVGLATEPRRAAAVRGTELTPQETKDLGKETLTGKTEADRISQDLQVRTMSNAKSLLDLYEAEVDLSPQERGMLRVTVGQGLFTEEDRNLQHQRALELTNLRGSGSIDLWFNRQQREDAQWLWRQANGFGTVDEWQAYLTNPASLGNRLTEFDKAREGIDIRDKLGRAAPIASQLRIIHGDINRAVDERRQQEVPGYLQLANAQLRTLDVINIPGVNLPKGLVAKYETLPEEKGFDIRSIAPGGRPLFGGRKQLFYEDAEGKVYSPELVEGISSGTAKLVPDTPEESQTAQFDADSFEQSVSQTLSRIPIGNLDKAAQDIINANLNDPNINRIRVIVNRAKAQRRSGTP